MAPRGRKPKIKNEQENTELFEKNRFIILPGKSSAQLFICINNYIIGTNIMYLW